LAVENGISKEAIEHSVDTAYHDAAETIPFSYEFTKRYQTEFLMDYFLNKERLLKVLPLQMKILTENELVQKYNSYLPWEITSLKDLLNHAELRKSELESFDFIREDFFKVAGLNKGIQDNFPVKKPGENALRILFLDLSQNFSADSGNMLYDVVEPPLGLMYIMTYLNKSFVGGINGKIAKSRIDFDSFHALKQLIDDFKPDVIGVRSLNYYRNFFHKTIALVRQWGWEVPVITGGPYATSCCSAVLNDKNIDMVILGEGELTLKEVIQCIIDHGGKLPDNDTLLRIPGIALSGERGKPGAKNGCRDILLLDHSDSLLKDEAVENPEVEIEGDNTIYQIYTSGSTGTPKGAMVKHHSFTNLVNWYNREFDINSGHRMLLIASTSFDLAQKNLYATLAVGGQLHLFAPDSYDYEMMSEVIEREGITIVNCTPSAFYPLLDINEENAYRRLKSLKYVFLGGETINMAKLLPWMNSADYHCEVVNTYGPTECTDVISYYRIKNNDADIKTIPVGRPVDNARLYILDKNYGIMPVGVEGELYAGGVCVGKGYYKDKALTGERFIEVDKLPDRLLYKTGDNAKWLPDGNIEFVGRVDNQVKIRGFRIETGEIEAKLLKYKSIKEATVAVRENADKGKYICAYMVAEQDIETSDITAFLKNELPAYMLPAFYIRLEKLPLTPSGKVDRKALPDPLDASGINTGTALPGSELEKALAEIWRKVLSIDNVGVDDNFFEIGGHSIKAIEVINKVHKLLNVKISVSDLFSHSTIRSLSELIEGKGTSSFTEIRQLPDLEYYKLSYGQKRLWVLNRLNPLSTAYNIQGSFMMNESVDPLTVEKVMNLLAERHEGLRTRFVLRDDEPVQIVDKKVRIEVPLLCSASEREQAVEQLAGHVFDLEKAPLLSVRLVKLDNENYELLFCMHHIISDGWSMEILKKDFMDCYAAYKQNRNIELKPLKIQYKDYAAWQNDMLQDTDKMEKAKAYWRSKLTGPLPEVYVARDMAYSEERGRNSAAYRWMLGEKSLKDLKAMAVRYETSLFNVLLTAYAVMLSDLSGRKDVALGIAGTAREHEDLREVIGFFVNTVLVRSTMDLSEAFGSQLKCMHREVMAALEYQTYPLELIAQELKVKFPSIRMFFNMLNIGDSAGSSIAPFAPEHMEKVQECKFDIVLYATEYANGLEIRCDYLTGMYKKETIVYLMERYRQKLMSISEDAGCNTRLKSDTGRKRVLKRLINEAAK
ncbi:MAG TPA: condensation domain-containing protein, partial [Clostridia bacterium]|nr:condensation domain-containing protein [Clostridia bacterium]